MSALVTVCNLYKKIPHSWFTKDRRELFFRMVADAKLLDHELGRPPCEDPWILEYLDEMDELDAGGYRGADAD